MKTMKAFDVARIALVGSLIFLVAYIGSVVSGFLEIQGSAETSVANLITFTAFVFVYRHMTKEIKAAHGFMWMSVAGSVIALLISCIFIALYVYLSIRGCGGMGDLYDSFSLSYSCTTTDQMQILSATVVTANLVAFAVTMIIETVEKTMPDRLEWDIE